MTTIEPLLAPPPIPDKYDIIPIHASDVASFKRCRRYWDWSSPARKSLRRNVSLFGIYVPFWFGSGIHYALEQYYNPGLRRDPVEAFLTWFHLQWQGGNVAEDWLEYTYDLNPRLLPTNLSLDGGEGVWIDLYAIQGLRDLLPSPDEEEFMGYRELGLGMMEFYKDYAAREDDFEVVAAEAQFSIPLGFEADDIREQSPNFGKKLEVHARGKRDAIVFYPERKDPRKQFGILEHKTAAKIDEEYFLKLENDPQCTTYIVAIVKEAMTHDLPWKTVTDVLYNGMRKAYPKPPSITTRGFPSLDKSKESTTADMFMQAVTNMGLVDWYHDDPKAQGYYEYLLAEGDKVFVVREHARRNEYEISAAYAELQMVAREMLDPNVNIYKHPSGDRYCTRCQFRAPCLAKDDGSDWKGMLNDGYELNRDR
jgi:hypothetical protein